MAAGIKGQLEQADDDPDHLDPAVAAPDHEQAQGRAAAGGTVSHGGRPASCPAPAMPANSVMSAPMQATNRVTPRQQGPVAPEVLAGSAPRDPRR